jgi:CO dehydrogenase maturation factor
LERLIENYTSIVMDNEAGMEHMSRLTTNNFDILLVVSDPTRRGLQAAARIVELADKLSLHIGRKVVMVNRFRADQAKGLDEALAEYKLDFVGTVPEDADLQKFDLEGRPTTELGMENKAVAAAYRIFDSVLQNVK